MRFKIDGNFQSSLDIDVLLQNSEFCGSLWITHMILKRYVARYIHKSEIAYMEVEDGQ